MKYDLIVAGCGFSGAVIAHLAAKRGDRVLLVEKRGHIAGNMYDYVDEAGILVQKYGPHSLHTNHARVRAFLSGLWEWEPFILRARAMIRGRATPSPFNLKTIDDYYAPDRAGQLKERLKAVYGDAKKTTIVELLESPDPVIREYAQFLFEEDYRPYTAKQWGIAPETLDVSVLKRVPVRLDYTDAYFDDDWQVLPKKSFTAFFERVLDLPGIELRLRTNILDHLSLDSESGTLSFDGQTAGVPVVYTGPLDELFGCCYGSLPYRSLRFEWKTLDMDSFQETPGVAHPKAEGFTRITEYTKQPPQDGHGRTTIAVEYPAPYQPGGEAYYPILTEQSQQLAARYRALAKRFPHLYLCGRLADFKYYNMDEAVLRALELFEML